MSSETQKATYPIRYCFGTLLAGIVAATSMTEARGADYSFSNIADSGRFNSFGEGVSINNHGTVAFTASSTAGGWGVFTGAGGPLTTLVNNNEEFNFFRTPSINDSGVVAFYGEFSGSKKRIYSTGGGPVITIAETISDPFPRQVFFPVINAQGTVAFRVAYHELDPQRLNFAIRSGNGGPLTLIADSSGPLFLTNSTPLHMNDSGTVAFAALLDGSGVGLFTGNGGSLTTVVTGAAGFTGFNDPSINNNGTLAFSSQRTDGVRGIFTTSGGPVTTVADSSGPFNDLFGRDAIINDQGVVIFGAGLDAGGFGIFTGPDPVADKVIRTGDSLFGSTVTAVGRFDQTSNGTFDINDNGEIAFRYELANGAFGIAVARVVPEPSSMMLLAAGVLGARRPVRTSLRGRRANPGAEAVAALAAAGAGLGRGR